MKTRRCMLCLLLALILLSIPVTAQAEETTAAVIPEETLYLEQDHENPVYMGWKNTYYTGEFYNLNDSASYGFKIEEYTRVIVSSVETVTRVHFRVVDSNGNTCKPSVDNGVLDKTYYLDAGNYRLVLYVNSPVVQKAYYYYVRLAIESHEHAYEFVKKVPATCSERGYSLYECSCGDTQKKDYVNKLPHTEVDAPRIEPTCGKPGKEAGGTKCAVCGVYILQPETIPATGLHTEVVVEGKPATCTKTGLTDGVKCAVCGTITYAQQVIPPDADNHNEKILEARAPTCLETGLTEGRKCKDCGKITLEQEVVEKLPHTEVTIPAEAPTCLEAGAGEGKKCTACNTVTVPQEHLPALGHSFTDLVCTRCKVFDGLARGKVNDSIIWFLSKDGELTIDGTGPMYDTEGMLWWEYTDQIKKVVIREGVTTIVNTAFKGCSALEEISIADSVEVIEAWVFTGCSSLKKIDLPDSLTTIAYYAFAECEGLQEIRIPDSVTEVGMSAFEGCTNLTKATLSGGMTEIPDSLFLGCRNLAEVIIPEGITKIGKKAFSECDSLIAAELPAGVTEIGKEAFNFCRALEKISLPDTLTKIESWAFNYCEKLNEIDIPDSVTVIGTYAFSSCSDLTEMVVPDSVTNIGYNAFNACYNLAKLVLPQGLTEISNSLCANCKALTQVNIPETVTRIGNGAFNYCSSLSEITIPQGVTEIGDSAFANCEKLTQIEIPYGITQIGSGAFTKTGITQITIPAGVERIGRTAFYRCKSLTEVKMPKGVTELVEHAFSECDNLKTLYWPESLSTVGTSAFKQCHNIETVYYGGTEEQWNALEFDTKSMFANAVIHYNAYAESCAAHTWNDGKTILQATEETEGTKLFVCAVCGDTKTETLPRTEHVHSYTEVTTAPSCTTEGYTTYTCSCGESYVGNSVKPIGHKTDAWFWDEKNHWQVCSVCEETLEPEGHEGNPCSVCGYALPVEDKHEFKLGDVNHDGKINAKDATLLLQKVVGVLKDSVTFCEACADVSGDGKLNAKDSTLILQFSVGLRQDFPAQK